jgi:hypothetical protein
MLTLHPGLPGGDAGELAAAACAGGIAHPPGYPLHGLLLRFVALWSSRLALSSALCGALTVGLLVDLVTRWTKQLTAGLVAGAAWFAAPLAWRYETTVEVFALHALLVTALAWALTVDLTRRTRKTALLLGVLSGLALTHHQTSVFVVLPVLLARVGLRRDWRALGLGLLLGCSPLLLLPLWSAHDTRFSWGELRTVDGVLTHLLRREYGTFQLASGAQTDTGLARFLSFGASVEAQQSYGLVALLALVGVGRAFGKARRFVLAGVAAWLGAVVVFGALTNLSLDNALYREVVARFLLIPHLLLCAAAGLAWAGLTPRWSAVAAVLLVGLGLAQRPPFDDLSVRRYGLALLDQPAGALVLTQGDLIGNTMRELQACEGVHAELLVVDQQLLTYDWYVARLRRAEPTLALPEGTRWHPTDAGTFTLQQLLLANAQRPLIVCGGFKAGDVTTFRAVPWGLCERLLPPGAAFDAEAWFHESEARLPALDWSAPHAPEGSWEAVVRRDVWGARAQRGLTCLTEGIARHDDVTWLTRAVTILEDCAAHDEAPAPAVFKNLGIAHGRLGHTAQMKQALTRYVQVAPASDPELPTVRALLAAP